MHNADKNDVKLNSSKKKNSIVIINQEFLLLSATRLWQPGDLEKKFCFETVEFLHLLTMYLKAAAPMI